MKFQQLNILGYLAIWSIPFCFICAGTGMLILLNVVHAEGDFYTRLQSESESWILAHLILLLGSISLLPAAIGIRTLISGNKTGIVATIMVPIVAVAGALMSGQYAIDFLMPEIARLGNEAHEVHRYMSSDRLVNILFYNLPELSSLALFIMSIALVIDCKLSKILSGVLVLNWILVIIGNLISPTFQRLMLLMLGITFIFIILTVKRIKDNEMKD